ncbi:MAG: hypothetical protein ACEQSR_01450 [Candidatus Methylacidiphilales bacterium]
MSIQKEEVLFPWFIRYPFYLICLMAMTVIIHDMFFAPIRTVKVTFCDGRSPVYFQERMDDIGDISYMIENYKLAVPEYNGYLNVCKVEAIK